MATAKKKPATQKPVARSAPAPRGKAKPAPPPKAPAKPAAPAKGKRCDYEAVERDYRTGTFTDQELGDKYGKSRQAITKMAKVRGWKKDLSVAVRQVTKALVIAEAAKEKVAEQVAKGSAATLDGVLAAATTNAQVILKHRKDIVTANTLLNNMMGELQQVTVNPAKLQELMEVLTGAEDMTHEQVAEARAAFADLQRLPNRILSIQRISQAMARLQALERTAFGLDEPEQPPPPDEAGDLSDEELEARILERTQRIQAAGPH